MNKFAVRYLFDKAFLLGLCLMLVLKQNYQTEMIIFVLAVIVLSLLLWLKTNPKFSSIGLLLLLLASIWWKEYTYFVPVLFYDGMLDEGNKVSLINGGVIVLFLFSSKHYSVSVKLYIILLCALAAYLAFLTLKDYLLSEAYDSLEKEKYENSFDLEWQNSELIKQQEIKVNLELSNERNRIARDIHDNVGHLLSSALLQTGALKAINQEEKLTAPLNQLQETINEGMNSIRESVHDLHDESLSLSLACQNIVQSVTFCEVEIIGSFSENISKDYKLTCIMLLKEALANVMKHSNAEKVTIEFQEHPGFYKLIIEDNGTQNQKKSPKEIGIGLIGMKERVEKLGGRLSYQRKETGFSLLAILPK
ncbi:sensor histidine kinase, partial [Enterococcus crotali]|uniref:sensor histidine kinase n=1 Tax=Enterococcus crotali TaxID=1453587 RepID=UPI0004A7B8A3